MPESDLQVRPVYRRERDSVEAHLTIVFAVHARYASYSGASRGAHRTSRSGALNGCMPVPLFPGPRPSLIRPRCLSPEIRGARGIFPICWPGPRGHARAMNTATVKPGAPAAGNFEPHSGTDSGYQAGPERRALRRPVHDRMLTGVAAGLAEHFGLDVTIVRVAFVVLAVVGGAGIPLYLAGLLLIPEQGRDQSMAGAFIESRPSRSR
jgi:phage shock protein PspC (stress-responsive transcriptional regulator)